MILPPAVGLLVHLSKNKAWRKVLVDNMPRKARSKRRCEPCWSWAVLTMGTPLLPIVKWCKIPPTSLNIDICVPWRDPTRDTQQLSNSHLFVSGRLMTKFKERRDNHSQGNSIGTLSSAHCMMERSSGDQIVISNYIWKVASWNVTNTCNSIVLTQACSTTWTIVSGPTCIDYRQRHALKHYDKHHPLRTTRNIVLHLTPTQIYWHSSTHIYINMLTRSA